MGRIGFEVAATFAGGVGVASKASKGAKAAEGLADVADAANDAARGADKVGDSSSLKFLVTKRKAIATEFYRQQGFAEHRIASHLEGIDFTKPVEVVSLKPPAQVVQYQVPGAPQGTYYSNLGVTPEKLGISSRAQDKSGNVVQRIPTKYEVDTDVQVLRSTAASVTDTWSIPGQSVKAEGGGIQFFTTNNEAFKAVE